MKRSGWEVLPHLPYSSDFAPLDFPLFRSLEHFIGGKNFQEKAEVKNSFTDFVVGKEIGFCDRGLKMLPSR